MDLRNELQGFTGNTTDSVRPNLWDSSFLVDFIIANHHEFVRRAIPELELERIIMLLQLDISALMGYTGAFYKEVFGTNLGMIFSLVVLLIWSFAPLLLAAKIFSRKDL